MKQSFSARRSMPMAANGMVVSSQPLASQAGLEVLKRGGNAIDATVAIAAVLNVTEPMSTGIGGGQAILVHPEYGTLMGGSDPRKDGCAMGF